MVMAFLITLKATTEAIKIVKIIATIPAIKGRGFTATGDFVNAIFLEFEGRVNAIRSRITFPSTFLIFDRCAGSVSSNIQI